MPGRDMVVLHIAIERGLPSELPHSWGIVECFDRDCGTERHAQGNPQKREKRGTR